MKHFGRSLCALLILVALAGIVSSAAQAGLSARSGTNVSATPSLAALTALATPTTGAFSLAVVLVNFADDRSTPWTTAQAQSSVSTGLNSYYAEASGNQASFTVSAFGWYPLTAAGAACDYHAWKTEAFSQAQAAGVNLASYSHVMLLFPPVAGCSWTGMGTTPGAATWINGSIDVHLTAHEIGHNLGLNHANAWVCPVGVMIGSGCATQEYGDPFDVMGNSWSGVYEFSSWHKAQLGWLDTGEQQTVSVSGDYSLVADEAARGSGVKLLQVPLADGSFYAVETRAATGQYDSMINRSTTTGVLVRLVPGSYSDLTTRPSLIDGNPATTTFDDAAFQVGQCLGDPVNNLSITTLSAANGHAAVHVSLGTAACASGANTVTGANTPVTPVMPVTPVTAHPSASQPVKTVGNPTVGSTLHASLSADLRNQSGLSFQWQTADIPRKGSPAATQAHWRAVKGAYRNTLKLSRDLAGHRLRIVVRVAGVQPRFYSSAATAPVKPRR